MRKMRWVSILLLVTFITSFVPFQLTAQAVEPTTLQAKFDSVDTAGGNWFKTATNESSGLAWNESYVMNGYMVMYEVTKDTKYLDKLVDHGLSVLKTRDSERKVTDYRGLSLPAWRTTKYTVNSQPYIFAGHTGMITYPMADFARVVYKNPALWPKYKAQADILLKAAKDAVAVHDDEWRENGDTGWYIERKGAPEKWDGANIPSNLMLAIARTQLAIYQATGEQVYFDRVKKMAQYFKNNLTTDSTGAYLWHYTTGLNYDGWTAADGVSVNTPTFSGYKAWEDVSHGSIDVDFAVLAYQAGIVFTDSDMKKFGLTVENKMLRADGTVAYTVQGTTVSSSAVHIGRWLRINKWAPSLFDYANKLSFSGSSGLLAIAKLNQANAENLGIYNPTDPGTTTSTPAPTPAPAPVPDNRVEMIANGTFDQGRTGWSGTLGSVNAEANGNNYAVNGYTWHFYQDFQITPGTDFKLNALTRKGTAAADARFNFAFFNAAGTALPTFDYRYTHKGTGWEAIPEVTVPVPAEAVKARLYLLASTGTGTHDFDNISFTTIPNTVVPGPTDPPVTLPDTQEPSVLLEQPADGALVHGLQVLQASATDDTSVSQVYFEYANVDGTWAKLGDAVQEAGIWKLQIDSADLADGSYNLRAVALDPAGNVGFSTNTQINIDNTKPVVSQLTISPQELITDGSAAATLSYKLSEPAQVAVNILNSAGLTIKTLFQGNQNSGDQVLTWDGKDAQGVIVPGLYTIKIEAVDQAGNQGDPVTANLNLKELDKIAPTVIMAEPSNGILIMGSKLVKVQATDNTSVTKAYVEYTTDGGASWIKLGDAVQAGDLWNFQWDTTVLTDGSYSLRAVALDPAGNMGTSSQVTVKIDNTKPVIGLVQSRSLIMGTEPLKVTATDNTALAKVTFQVSNNQAGPWTTIGDGIAGNGFWNLSWNTATLADGAYFLRATVTDQAGNTAESDVVAVTVDNTKPVLSLLTLTPDKFIADGTAKTNVMYQLSEAANVKTIIYNSAGMPVKTLFQGSQSVGTQLLTWDGKGDNGSILIPGAYTLKIEAADFAGNQGSPLTSQVTLLTADTSETVVNGTFTDDRTGWSSGGTIKTESNDNKFVSTNYSWQLYQNLKLTPGKQYKLNALTRKGTAASGVRVYVVHVDAAGKVLDSTTIRYTHKGTGWENIPETSINVPAGTAVTRLYLLVDSGTGTHDFDNISVKYFEPIIKNGSFNDNLTGWNSGGTIKTEANGNNYVEAKYAWHLYQDVKLTPGEQYQLAALTRKGTSTTGSRIYIAHIDASGKIITDQTIRYTPIGTGWEKIPTATVSVPSGAVTTRIFLLANSGTGTVDFDDIAMNQL